MSVLYYTEYSPWLELKLCLLLEKNPEEIKTEHYFNLSLTYIKPLFRGLRPWKHSKHLSKQYPKFHKLTTSLFSSTISINGVPIEIWKQVKRVKETLTGYWVLTAAGGKIRQNLGRMQKIWARFGRDAWRKTRFGRPFFPDPINCE